MIPGRNRPDEVTVFDIAEKGIDLFPRISRPGVKDDLFLWDTEEHQMVFHPLSHLYAIPIALGGDVEHNLLALQPFREVEERGLQAPRDRLGMKITPPATDHNRKSSTVSLPLATPFSVVTTNYNLFKL